MSLMKIQPVSQTRPETAIGTPLISVVVPVHNEAPNIPPLIEAISRALAGIDHEIVYVDDGSSDTSPAVLAGIAQTLPTLVRVRHKQSCGQSAAVITGVRAARGIFIATLDGDGQNDPLDIPAMLEAALAAEQSGAKPVLIAGHRVTRKDSDAKRYGSRIANAVRGRLLKDGTPDTGCGLKLFRREAFLQLPHFDHLHRFLPALFIRAGGHVISLPVNHRPRLQGTSKYGTLDRALVGLVDLFGVAWLQRRARRPAVETLE